MPTSKHIIGLASQKGKLVATDNALLVRGPFQGTYKRIMTPYLLVPSLWITLSILA